MFDYQLMSEDVKEMNMTQLTHNQFFIKDGEAWHRDFDREISCRNLAREIAANNGIWSADDPEMTDDEVFDEAMLENLMYGTSDLQGVLAIYYSAMWGMAEVRAWYMEAKAELETAKPYMELAEKLNLCDLVRENKKLSDRVKLTEALLKP